MKLVLFYLIVCSFIYADSYPSFTQTELQKIRSTNVISNNRIIDYRHTLIRYKKLSKTEQLKKVNYYLNQLLPQYDAITQHQQDEWATPKEFLKLGYGDCEDYVLIKYYSLIKLGFDKKRLFLTVVKDKFEGGYHMVLSYFYYKNRPPLILDNLSSKILDIHTRKDLTPLLFINTTGVYKIDKAYKLHKVAKKYKEFEEVQNKVKNNF